MDRRAQAARWVDAVWGERRGHCHFAFGVSGHFNSNGKYEFDHWQERHGRWPDDRDRFLDEAIEKSAECDVYVAPYLRSNTSRKKGSALPSDILYGDLDDVQNGCVPTASWRQGRWTKTAPGTPPLVA